MDPEYPLQPTVASISDTTTIYLAPGADCFDLRWSNNYAHFLSCSQQMLDLLQEQPP